MSIILDSAGEPLLDSSGQPILDDNGQPLLDESGQPLLDEFNRPIVDDILIARPASTDYADAFLALLPTGAVWPRDTESIIAQAANAIALTFARCAARALAFLQESPAGAGLIEMLPEWEVTEGLPDPCAGPDPTVAFRQTHVRARLAHSGGQSVSYFIDFAASLGFSITVAEFAPSRFGQSFGEDFAGEAWAHVWLVGVAADIEQPFPFDQGRFGEPFVVYGDTVLQCELNRIKPAHTILLFGTTVHASGNGSTTADSTTITADSLTVTADAI